MKIKNIKSVDLKSAVKIFTAAFVNDTLFMFAFPDIKKRKRLTQIMYEFVVYIIVPEMKLKLKGLYINDRLVVVGTYTTPESKTGWTDNLDKAVKDMWKKANDNSIRLIGEYSMKSREFKIKQPHFYFNELAVMPIEQGKGYGKKMFNYIESECLKHPTAKGIALDTPNPNNVKIYKHLGYEVKHKFKFYNLTGYTMYKKIK
jgi:GNAT superfamily N-acetyltransferase